MTISSENRKAGPFAGNDSTTVFPFEFKVFSASDLQVIQAASATGVESTLELDTDYAVSLSADQDANPGGNITLNSALASGYTLTIVSSLENLQTVDFTNQGGFYPSVINKAFDRLTIMVQQVSEQVGRAVKVSVSSNVDPDDYLEYVADSVAQAQAYASTASSKADSADSSSQSASTSAQNAAASESAAAGYAASMVQGQFAIKADTQASAYTTATATGTADAIVAGFTPAITTDTAGRIPTVTLTILPTAANTGAGLTIDVGTGEFGVVKGAGTALVAGDVAGAGSPLVIRGVRGASAAADKWVLLNPAYAVSAVSAKQIQSVTATVTANALTLGLNPTTLDFRSSSLTSGAVNTRTISDALSLVVPSGATLGTVARRAARLALIAIDNVGTVELAVSNIAGSVNLDETTLISTTAISASATSASVVYSTIARTSVPFRVVGFVDITEATAGTWTTAPTTVQGVDGLSFASKLIPLTGAVVHFAMPSAPPGWLKANGATVSRTAYATLYAAIGTTFGTGDGSTTFKLPDLRGEFIRCWDDSRGVDSGRLLGSYQGGAVESHSHAVDLAVIDENYGIAAQRPSHSSTPNSVIASCTSSAYGSTETRPRNSAHLACIKY